MSSQEQQGAPAQDQSAGTATTPAEAVGDVARLTAEKNDLNDRLLRLAAEFENYKRRIRKETDDASVRAQESILKDILPVLYNLDRALVAARGSEGAASANALIEGVQMVQKLFLVAMEKFQVKPFEADGQPFDPQVHEAVQQLETDKVPAGSVALVFQRGWKIGGKLLRPALVAVAKAPPASTPAN